MFVCQSVKNVFLIVILLFLIISCDEEDKPVTSVKAKCSLVLSKNKLVEGDVINFEITSTGKEVSSVSYFMDDMIVENNESYKVQGLSLGKHKLKGVVAYVDGAKCEKYLFIEVITKQTPKLLSYKVVNRFPHDNMSYTQGLEYVDGEMYESTGQYGFSFIHHYNLLDLKSKQRVDMAEDVFGEGITLFDDKLYQATYHKEKAYVYDVKTLKKINEFSYHDMGWGLTHDENHIIMSNGSNEIVFRNPDTFEIEKSIFVYDDNGQVDNINELEYVDGFIYANIYQSNIIIKIENKTGLVVARIDCTGILKPSDITSQIDVLNGIAYNPSQGTFYITGKFWPLLFEVRFIER